MNDGRGEGWNEESKERGGRGRKWYTCSELPLPTIAVHFEPVCARACVYVFCLADVIDLSSYDFFPFHFFFSI